MSKGLIVVLFIVAIIVLQLYLSKQKNKWLGLVLPLMTVGISLIVLLGLATFYNVQSIHVETQTVTEDGVVTKHVTEKPVKVDTSTIKESIFLGGYILVLYNIPTVILLLIYKGARKKLKRELEIKKMNIQDLE